MSEEGEEKVLTGHDLKAILSSSLVNLDKPISVNTWGRGWFPVGHVFIGSDGSINLSLGED